MSTRLSPSLRKHNLKVLFADLDVILAPVHVVFVNWEHTSPIHCLSPLFVLNT
jgi:hypothetical protein